ncbi:hypothetical protein [Hydrogenophaga sp. PML113]|uniref:hypothetical protein n=1 Tax=Hydrogenophaga sp. PML113 TaxID=1899350 RepID=UPI001113102D|nr:hypothetical protein [Hydrogenophaga sp. PML113]
MSTSSMGGGVDSFGNGAGMFKSRNVAFKFQLPIGADEVWGVGLVTVKWAMLEDSIDSLLEHMNSGPALTNDGKPMGFKSRMRLFKQIVKRDVASVSNALYLEAFADRVLGFEGQRNSVTHHIWSDTPDGKLTQFDWRRKSGRPSERSMNTDKLIQLAQSLDSLQMELWDFLIREGCVKVEQPIFETAWRRISRPPSPKK